MSARLSRLSAVLLISMLASGCGSKLPGSTGHPEPPARYLAALGFDEARKEIVLFGGAGEGTPSPIADGVYPPYFYLRDTWTWDGQAWTEHQPQTVPPFERNSMAFDPELNRLVMTSSVDSRRLQTWSWDGADWVEIAASIAGYNQAPFVSYDPATRQLVMIASNAQSLVTWTLKGKEWARQADSPALGDYATAFDGKELVLVGDSQGPTETREWNGSSWTVAHPQLSPPSRGNRLAAFPPQKELLLLGSNPGTPGWAWRDGQWSEAPAARVDAVGRAVVYYPPLNSLLAYGGFDAQSGKGILLGDLEAWDGAAWRQLDPGPAHTPTAPTPPASPSTTSRYSRGTITTVAGNGTAVDAGDGGPASAATLNSPLYMAIDHMGDIYFVTDQRVREISADGVIKTVAGNGTTGYSGDGGPAQDAQLNRPLGLATDVSGNLYIADTVNDRIRKVSSGIISTFARVSDPRGLAIDSAGNVYVSEFTDDVVVRITPTGQTSVVAGTGIRGYSGDGGLATKAMLKGPETLAIGSTGNLFINDLGVRIREVAVNGMITTFAGNGQLGGGFPVSNPRASGTRCVSPSQGDGGPATSVSLAFAVGLAVDRAGNLFISEYSPGRIRVVDARGTINTVANFCGLTGFSGDGGPALEAALSNPADLAIGSGSALYVCDEINNRIRAITFPVA